METGRVVRREEHVMPRQTRSTLLAAALFVTLSGPAGPLSFLEGLQTWLVSLWSDAGSIMDPDGRNGVQGDAGGFMDPDGRDRAEGDAGGIMDPNG
jgi:hypothetical protein